MATSSLSTQDFFSTTLSSTITGTDTTIFLNSLPTPTEGYLVLESTNSSTREVIYYTSKGANFVTCPSVALGRGLGGTTAQAHSSGATVEMNMTSEHWKALQDGTAFTAGVLTFATLANNTEGEFGNNFVSSGLSVTGASSSLVATMTSGISYVAGKRVVPAVGGRTYQASSDTYVDLKSDATFTYTGGTSGNSGASIPLTANSIRLAKVQTHATGVNAITSGIQSDNLAGTASVTGQSLDRAGNALYPALFKTGTIRQTVDATTASAAFVSLTGLTLNIQPQVSSILVLILTADVDIGTSGDVAVLQMLQSIPGNAALNGNIIAKAAGTADRKTQSQTWSQPLTSGTAYTFIPQVERLSGAGTITVHASHTALTFFLIPVGAN